MRDVLFARNTATGWVYSLSPTIVSIAFAISFMLVAAAAYWPMHQLAFLSDDSPVAWLSSAQLWAIAVLALRLGIDRTLPILFAAWIGVAMLLLAFDEQFMFHEQWKYGCTEWISACDYLWVRELPMIFIGLLGGATVYWLHKIIPVPKARTILWAAFGVGAIAISLDLISWLTPITRYEEAVEVLAEALFLGFLLGLRRATCTQ